MGAKLIRDKMPDIPWKVEAAKQGIRPVSGGPEHWELLRRKLLEEVGEFLTADTVREEIDELADIYEVLDGLCHVMGPGTRDEVARAKLARRDARGGFEHGVVWEV